MTLPAELRAEADRRVPGVNAYYHDEPTRALLQRAADALEWRLIESAPKDGTQVLLWSASGDEAVVGEWLKCASPYWLTGLGGDFDASYTHWRPLDAPLPATPEGNNNSTNDEERV